MPSGASATWSFLTNQPVCCSASRKTPGSNRARPATAFGISKRVSYNTVTKLAHGGYTTRERHGRRNHYTIHIHVSLLYQLAFAGCERITVG